MTPSQDRHEKLVQRETHVVNVSKRTTKVNIIMAVGLVAFFIATAVVVGWIWKHPRETTNSVHQQVKQP